MSDELCGANNASAEVVVQNGNPPYQYVWEDVLNPGVVISTANQLNAVSAGTYFVTVTNQDGSCPVFTTVTVNGVEAPVVDNLTTNSATCGQADGFAGVMVSGGTGSYLYNWEDLTNPGQTISVAPIAPGLTAGTYAVTIANDDGSCPIVETFNVGNIDGPSVTDVQVTGVSCAGSDGAVDITVSGGIMPYQFEWENTAFPGMVLATVEDLTGMVPGTYQITISNFDGTCPVTATVDVLDECLCDPAFDVAFTTTPTGCELPCDGAIDLTVNSGTAPLTYNWENPANPGVTIAVTEDVTGLCAGDYCVTVTDANGCTAEGCTTIGQLDAPNILDFTFVPELCGNANGSATLEVEGGSPPYQYSWASAVEPGIVIGTDNPLTNVNAGIYLVTVTNQDGSCPVTSNVVVDGIPIITVDDVTITPASCDAADGFAGIMVTGGTGTYQYAWENTNSPGNIISVAPIAPGLSSGTYQVTITNSDGTCPITEMIQIPSADGPTITDTPTTEESCAGNDGSASVVVSGGTPPYLYNWEASDNPGVSLGTGSAINDLTAGTYLVTVTNADGTCPFTGSVEVMTQLNDLDATVSIFQPTCPEAWMDRQQLRLLVARARIPTNGWMALRIRLFPMSVQEITILPFPMFQAVR